MKLCKMLMGGMMILGSFCPVHAQIGEIVNGLTNVALPVLRGGHGYKGYVEMDYTRGFGNFRSNFGTFATSQGYMFNDWFYMGGGIGVDLLWSKTDKGWTLPDDGSNGWHSHEFDNTAWMIPIFSDFRFIFGNPSQLSFFLNLRIGAAFLCSDNYVRIGNGYLTDNSYFYLQPAAGIRIPVSTTKPRQAIDVGIHYRLMTSRDWSTWEYNSAINGFGASISYEW